MKKTVALLFFVLSLISNTVFSKNIVYNAGYFVGQIVTDALDLHYNLFSCDSAKILTGFIPLYILTRAIEEDIQCHFYDATSHKNINQFSHHCHTAAKVGVSIPMVLLSSLCLWGWNDDIRYTGRMTAIGLPFVHSGKDIIKQARSRACLRPWHEHFDPHKRSHGGFPSGHMANVAYMATLWGLRHGPRWAVPLTFAAGFIFADFINQNRHYLSQMIAGAALGVLYGVAASKVVDMRLTRDLSFSVTVDAAEHPCCQLSYAF